MRLRVVLILTLLLLPEFVRPMTAVPATAGEVVHANALWEPPTGLHDRDLFYGPWGARLQPILMPFIRLFDERRTARIPV